MIGVLVALLGLQTAAAAWHDGHPHTIRPGAKVQSSAAAAAGTPKACFDACIIDERCLAWNFASDGCPKGQACELKSENLLPVDTDRSADGFRCNRTSGTKEAAAGLLPLKWKPLSLRDVTPTGWLRQQLVTMANGLSGHLDLFWNDVNESVWIGGTHDHSGAGHERGPYWLNGMVPLSAQLNNSGDAGTAKLDIDLTGQVNSWIFYILDHQLPSGWLGPDDGFGGKGNDYWTGWNTAASLLQYADAVGTETPMGKRAGLATLNYIKCIYGRMKTVPTTAWTQNRWQDWAYIIHWALDQDPQGMEQMLWDAAALTQAQSWDWDAYYNRAGVGTTGAYKGKTMPKFPLANVAHWDMYDHGVNNAMGTKSCSTWYRQDKNESAVDAAYHKLYMQDMWQGQPHGMFSADECFGGRALNRGIELCAVVEQMYSLQHMFRVHGDIDFLDRCERIAYNSLPGTISPDMWQHQYLQQANEINGLYGQTEHVWQTDGADSTGFGVAPNFGCCTANMQQGWPKMAANVLLADPAGGFLLALIAPVKYEADGVTVEVITDYPFGDDVVVKASGPASQSIPISVRVPGWATNATLNGKAAANGTIVKTACKGDCTITLSLNPDIRFEYGWGVHAGQTPELISYSSAGAAVPSNATSMILSQGAAITASKEPNAEDIRTGGPGDISMAILNSWVFSAGHSIEAVSFRFRYIAGYLPVGSPGGATLSLVALDAETDAELATFYTSPVLNKYGFAPFKGYSPAIKVDANNLNFVHAGSIKLALKFVNNKQNLQIPVTSTGLGVKVTWGSAGGRPAGKPGTPKTGATNAVSILRGPLLYSLPLDEKVKVVNIWEPFKNTDVDLTTDTAWNWILDVSKPPAFTQVGKPDAKLPFGHKYPGTIKVTAMPLASWNVTMQAAAEPEPSPVKCDSTCGAPTELTLVPYGATNLRISAYPWTKSGGNGHN